MPTYTNDWVWYNWADSTTTSATTDMWTGNTTNTAAVWTSWVGTTSTDGYTWPRYEAMPETDEQRAERERREAEAQRSYEERRREREAADERAKELLYDALTATQRRMHREQGKFRVRGSKGGIYEICAGSAGNVIQVDGAGRRLASYCIHPSTHVPEGDVHLAQKLMLETDEDSFVRIANVTRLAA